MLKKISLLAVFTFSLVLTACSDPISLHNDFVAEHNEMATALSDYNFEFSVIADGESTDALNTALENLVTEYADVDTFVEENLEDFSDAQRDYYIDKYLEDFRPEIDNYIEEHEAFLAGLGDTFDEGEVLQQWVEVYDATEGMNSVLEDLTNGINEWVG